jgi:hypothetical protein
MYDVITLEPLLLSYPHVYFVTAIYNVFSFSSKVMGRSRDTQGDKCNV